MFHTKISMILPVHPKTTDYLHQLLVGATKVQGVKAWIALFALILEQGKNVISWDKYSVSILSLGKWERNYAWLISCTAFSKLAVVCQSYWRMFLFVVSKRVKMKALRQGHIWDFLSAEANSPNLHRDLPYTDRVSSQLLPRKIFQNNYLEFTLKDDFSVN